METLINSHNFAHDDVSIADSFKQALDSLKIHGRNRGLQDVLNSLDALYKKLTTETNPKPRTQGCQMAQIALKEIVSLACKFVKDSSPKEIEQRFYLFIVHLLDHSITLLHLNIAYQCLQENGLQIKPYIKEFTKDSLTSFLSVVCKAITPEEASSGDDYRDTYYRFICEVLKDTLTECQINENYNFLLDYASYLYLDCIIPRDDEYSCVTNIGHWILQCVDNPFAFCDIERIKGYIGKWSTLCQSRILIMNNQVNKYSSTFLEIMMTHLGKQGQLQELYNEIFDLALVTSKCAYTSEGEKDLIELFYATQNFFTYFKTKESAGEMAASEPIVQRFIHVLNEMEIKCLDSRKFTYSVVNVLFEVFGKKKPQLTNIGIKLLVPLLKKPCESNLKSCQSILIYNKRIQWKENKNVIDAFIDILQSFMPPASFEGMEKKEVKKIKNYFECLNKTVEMFFESFRNDKLTRNYGAVMMDLSLKFINTEHEELHSLACNVAKNIELIVKEDKSTMIKAMKRFEDLLKDENLPWTSSRSLSITATTLIEAATKSFVDGKIFTKEELEVLVSICLICIEQDGLDPNSRSVLSCHFTIYLSLVGPLLKWLEASNRVELAAPLVPSMLKQLEEDNDIMLNVMAVQIMTFSQSSSGQKAASLSLSKLIEIYLENGNDFILMAITNIYSSNPKAFKDYFKDFIEKIRESSVLSSLLYLYMLFQKVSKMQAELFTSEDIEMFFRKALENQSMQVHILQILQELAKRCPHKMIEHIEYMFDRSAWISVIPLYYYIFDIMTALAFFKKDLAAPVVAEIFLSIKSTQDKNELLILFNYLCGICFKYPGLLKREDVNAISTSDPDVTRQKNAILDMIDGKTPDALAKKLIEQEEELAGLVGRVDDTEEIVIEVQTEVTNHTVQLGEMKLEVQEQGQKLCIVDVKVDETVIKVEGLDKKTLSHAPFWASDISKLLSPKSEHDWRLLSSRLGYNNEDIRGWAQQADPCMALLNEWYTTHKTSEATLVILKQLQEMDRLDAAVIVENAMKNSEAVVEDEEFEYVSPPQIFISYQWSHQAEVKLLKQHLEMAGYECWLDIGQMGGGDKLFQKIDTGIRAAKVVISCVTSNYAKSPNCIREVNLSVSLNKPIIPLLLEQCPWPPPGSMGPIFSEYLFIRFFQRTGEEMSDQRYWAKDKFQELLMQLNVVGVSPDETKVQPEYRNWWIPVVQEITIDKSKTKNGGTVAEVVQSDLDKIASESPDIFISYQWGKQKNIIKLYERLTSLGFSCWLDIKQMGGGDSLYDKIDRGIRGCKVVLSCVTQKYSLSANCRREVSLTDSLKKPMIPLLLEKMTWPPSGPMSMVMTQLVYINFSKDESIQMTWDGSEFNDLLNQIKQHIPNKMTTMTTSSNNSTEVAKSTTIIVSPSTKTTQNTLKPTSPLQKPERKNSQPTKSTLAPSLAPLKPQPKINQIQKLPSPVTSPPSTASSLLKQDSVKKSDTSVRAPHTKPLNKPLTKPLPSSKTLPSNKTQMEEQNNTSNNEALSIRPTSKTILKPISSDARQPSKQAASSKSPGKTQPVKTIQRTPGRPSRLPPIEQENGEKKSPAKKV